jgi:hypothetical protein
LSSGVSKQVLKPKVLSPAVSKVKPGMDPDLGTDAHQERPAAAPIVSPEAVPSPPIKPSSDDDIEMQSSAGSDTSAMLTQVKGVLLAS